MTGTCRYLRRLQKLELTLAASHRNAANSHAGNRDTVARFLAMAYQSLNHALALGPVLERRGAVAAGDEIQLDLESLLTNQASPRPHQLVRDQELYLSVCLVDLGWAALMPLGQQTQDRELVRLIEHCTAETGQQLAWIRNRIKIAAAVAPHHCAESHTR